MDQIPVNTELPFIQVVDRYNYSVAENYQIDNIKDPKDRRTLNILTIFALIICFISFILIFYFIILIYFIEKRTNTWNSHFQNLSNTLIKTEEEIDYSAGELISTRKKIVNSYFYLVDEIFTLIPLSEWGTGTNVEKSFDKFNDMEKIEKIEKYSNKFHEFAKKYLEYREISKNEKLVFNGNVINK